jgi:glutamate-1-semialdehyde 2,1-aminomutase
MVRYAKCGGEACTIAVRIARGATGRDKVLFCGYHGWHDWYLAANLGDEASLNQHLFPGIEPIGVPQALAGTAFPFPYGDYEALQSLLDRHAGEVAAVIMEPMRSAIPPAGYLEQVARATRAAGAVLIFDEVSAGYRYAFGGAQQYLGVTPDLAVFAKSMSNGYPMAAVVGRRDVMEAAGRMFISSTYWSDAIGLRAALTTLQEVRRRDLPAQLRRFGHDLKSCIQAAADATGAPIACTGHEVHPQLEFKIDDPLRRSQASTLYIQEMARRGCHGYASFYLNAAQDDADLRQTETAAREAFALIRTALDADALEDYLECELRQDAFRRLVR